jgi:uncharacterized Zn finger protein
MTDQQVRECPNCGAEVDYFSMPWHRVIARDGKPVCRRMGPCLHCGQWVRAVLAFSDEESDMRGWLLKPVDPYEIQQLEKGKQPCRRR